jgi:hypothetical protein
MLVSMWFISHSYPGEWVQLEVTKYYPNNGNILLTNSMAHEPGGSTYILKSSPKIPIPIPIPCITIIHSKSSLILSSHLYLGLPRGLFPVGLPTKILKAFLRSSILATCPTHLNILDLIALAVWVERHKLWS